MCLFHTFYDIPSPGQSSRAVIETEKYRPRLRQVQDGHGENDGKKHLSFTWKVKLGSQRWFYDSTTWINAVLLSSMLKLAGVFVFFFPQQRKLGVFSHSKGTRAGRSSQIRTAQGWEPGSQEGVSFSKRIPGKGSQVPRNRFPSNVPRNRLPSKVPRKRFPSKGSKEEVPRNRFPSKVPRRSSSRSGSPASQLLCKWHVSSFVGVP